MNFACVTGMAGAIFMCLVGLVTGQFLLLMIAIAGFMYCYQRRMMLREMGPEEFQDAVDYSASLRPDPGPSRSERRAAKRADQRVAEERAEQAKVDVILEKVSTQGMNSLSWLEKRTLRQATERQRQRDLESARRRR
jgi:hypothetical protein